MSDTAKDLAGKQKIVAAAIALYVDDRANFTMATIAKKTRIKKVEIYRLFSSRSAILNFYYPLCVLRYRAMSEEIADFSSWSLEEKLANFAYAMFDMLQEEREFVDEHFVEQVFRSMGTTRFQREVEALFGEWLGDACGGDWMASFLAREYLHVVRFWVADDSDDGERTMALVDKIAAFIGEVSRSSELVYKGVDLAKYLVANDIVQVPFGKNALAQIMRWAR